jgi:hypothetical protein
MAGLISVSTRRAAPDHVWHTGTRTRTPATAAAWRGTVTGRIAADEGIVVGWVVDDGENGVGTVDEEDGALCDEMGDAELAAFERVGACEEMGVDLVWVRLGLEIGYAWWVWCFLVGMMLVDGEIYDLGHGVCMR